MRLYTYADIDLKSAFKCHVLCNRISQHKDLLARRRQEERLSVDSVQIQDVTIPLSVRS